MDVNAVGHLIADHRVVGQDEVEKPLLARVLGMKPVAYSKCHQEDK